MSTASLQVAVALFGTVTFLQETPLMRPIRLALFAVLASILLAAVRPGHAQDMQLPGLDADADAYAGALQNAVPPDMGAAERTQIEQRAAPRRW
jgi:hypothetical protein